MKAMIQDGYGPHVLSLQDVELPRIGRNEVRLRVRAAGVNWADWSGMQGVPTVMRLMYGFGEPRNPIRGTDVAGTVDAIGEDVRDLRPGHEVFGVGTATFAEQACAAGDKLVAKPAEVSFEQAAAVPMAGLCALQALRDVGHVRVGQEVLIIGASGGIGTFAVQIAKVLGAHVTGVCSTANLDLVRSLGAERVIDYTRDDYTKGHERYDLILDMADDRSLGERRRLLTPRGTLIPNSGAGGRRFGSLGRIAKARLASPFVGQRFRPFLSVPKRQDLLTLRALIASEEVRPVVGRTYPLIEAADALAHVAEGHARGKVVLTM
jgi:NADPH:quinone reductase-like Zn-dependent oxidoreductase